MAKSNLKQKIKSEVAKLNSFATELKIKYLKTSEINPAKYNPREISDAAFEGLKESLKKFGFVDPLVINVRDKANVLVGGHQRLKAAQALEIKTVPVVEVDLSPAEEKALNITLNNHHISGNYTQETLQELLKEINTDLGDDFMTELKLDELLAPDAQIIESRPDDDETPEPKNQVSELGDVYELGNHRLMCGDSTSIDAVEKLINGNKIDLVFTDPPYGVKVVKSGKVGADFGIAKKGQYKEIINDETTECAKEFYNTCVALGFKNFIIWGGNYFTDFLEPKNSWVVWNKRGDTGIQNTFADGELAWSNLGFPVRIHSQLWNGMIRQGEKDKRVHPTQKPIQLAQFCFDLVKKCDAVYDGFGGSGSTLVACEKTQRKAYIMELDPHYVDVIVTRYCAYTGNTKIKRNGEEIEWEL